MTVDTLIEKYYENNPNGHYFDADTLRFFGERKSDMRVLKNTITITDYSGNKREVYVLSRLQRKHPSGPKRTYAYFDVKTFEDVLRKEEGGI